MTDQYLKDNLIRLLEKYPKTLCFIRQNVNHHITIFHPRVKQDVKTQKWTLDTIDVLVFDLEDPKLERLPLDSKFSHLTDLDIREKKPQHHEVHVPLMPNRKIDILIDKKGEVTAKTLFGKARCDLKRLFFKVKVLEMLPKLKYQIEHIDLSGMDHEGKPVQEIITENIPSQKELENLIKKKV